MITWDFYSKRRKVTLEFFLREVRDYQEALNLFKDKKILPPENLKSFFEKDTVKSQEVLIEKEESNSEKITAEKPKKPAEKKTAPSKKSAPSRRRSTKKQTQETVVPRDQLIEMLGQEKEETDKKDEKKPYFRKIIKPEKK